MKLELCKTNAFIDQMVSFQVAMAKETEDFDLDPATVKMGIQTVLDHPEKGRYLLAIEGDKLVGMLLTIPEWSDWRCKEVLWIHSVFIIPEHRGQKVFKRMYLYLKDLVESDNKYAGLRLYVDKTNGNAQRVYQALGMSNQHYELYEFMLK